MWKENKHIFLHSEKSLTNKHEQRASILSLVLKDELNADSNKSW